MKRKCCSGKGLKYLPLLEELSAGILSSVLRFAFEEQWLPPTAKFGGFFLFLFFSFQEKTAPEQCRERLKTALGKKTKEG